MEKRFILFILICFAIIPLYFRMVAPDKGTEDPNRTTPVGTPAQPRMGDTGGPPGVTPPVRDTTDPNGNLSPETGSDPENEFPTYPNETVVLENDVLRVVLTSTGAGVQEVVLPGFRENDRERELTLISPELNSGLGLITTLSGSSVPLERVPWEIAEQGPGRVKFRHPLGPGQTITKEFRLPAEGFELEVTVAVEGDFPEGTDFRYQLLGPDRIRFEPNTRSRANQRVIGLLDPRGRFADTDHDKVGVLPQRERLDARAIAWGGLESNYFAWVIRPDREQGVTPPRLIELGDPDDSRKLEYEGNHERGTQKYPFRVGFQRSFEPGRVDRYQVFLGPKDPGVLEAYEEFGYGDLIDYGSLGILVRLFLFLLRTFEAITTQWGIAIILLTVLVKVLLHPMNKRNQRTMQRQQKKMAKIQPQIKETRERHKSDPLKANQEIQKLFKEHEVNPAQMFGGCLMIFLQLPIWIGLINTFSVAIELRQASFLWIADLTAPDQLFELPVSLPFLGNWFNILPVLYVCVTLINQRMMPRSDDPQVQNQQKMMTFMMVAFGFIFYGFASGLMVYFLTSASLGILEQRIIRAELKHEDEKAAAAGGIVPDPSPVSTGGPAKPGPAKPGGAALPRPKKKRKST